MINANVYCKELVLVNDAIRFTVLNSDNVILPDDSERVNTEKQP